MASSRDRRVAKELLDIQADKDNSGVYAETMDDANLSFLVGSFPAPPDTPYAGGVYSVSIDIPEQYPFAPPKMRFITHIWHPNVSSQTGAICLDTLGTAWSPVQTIKTALLSLRVMLECPNPKDPQDAEVASMLVKQPEEFAWKAHDWAVRYAGAPRREIKDSQYRQQGQSSAGQQGASETLVPQQTPEEIEAMRYRGYNKNLIDRFVNMGFDVESVVEAFQHFGISRSGGQDFELEEHYVGDITARLLGES